jgi:hypothetical protein
MLRSGHVPTYIGAEIAVDLIPPAPETTGDRLIWEGDVPARIVSFAPLRREPMKLAVDPDLCGRLDPCGSHGVSKLDLWRVDVRRRWRSECTAKYVRDINHQS